MGYDEASMEFKVTCRVSRHNSPQDSEDDALLAELERRLQGAVRPLVGHPRYARLQPFLMEYGPA